MRDLRWAVPMVAFVAVGTFFSNGGGQAGHEQGASDWLVLAAAVLAGCSAGVARRAPEVGLLLTGLLIGAYFVLQGDNGPIYLTIVAATFMAAWWWPTRRIAPWAVTALVLAAVGIIVVNLLHDGADGGSIQVLALTGLTVAAGAVGARVRDRREARVERARLAATEEQLRMAQELHDGVGHGLAVIAMQAGVALHVLERDPAAARQSLLAIRETSRESLASLRAELSLLSGQAQRAPRRGLADLDALVARMRAGGLDVTVDARPPLDRAGPYPDGVDEAAYAIVQEALTNVLRHSSGHAVQVGLDRRSDILHVSVVDDGRGGAVRTEGMGISGMRARAERLGGSLEAGPTATGFSVSAVLPVSPS